MYDQVGSAYYIAPEVLQGKYTSKADMWSVGVITFLMLSGNPPFFGKNEAEILAKVAEANPSYMQGWQGVSGTAKDFVNKLLNQNYEERFSA